MRYQLGKHTAITAPVTAGTLRRELRKGECQFLPRIYEKVFFPHIFFGNLVKVI